MKLGVIIAVSNYSGSGLSDLPGCLGDANLIDAILGSQNDYHEILSIKSNEGSSLVKKRLIEFINKYKGKEISEFFFYFTGHGAFVNNEYYYLFSDYQSSKIRQTSLENAELDNLIRSLNLDLTTKIVDSCQSGIPYIKDANEIGQYLKGTQSGFNDCYFLFSSHTHEGSYQGKTLSAFTRAIGELVAKSSGPLRHKDLIDYIADTFSANQYQTPFFVVQADYTDKFCNVDDSLQKKIAALLTSTNNPSSSTPTVSTKEVSLKALIESDAKFFCTQEDASGALIKLKDYLESHQYDKESQELFSFKVTTSEGYHELPNLSPLGKWLEDNKNSYFAEATYEKVKVRRLKNASFSAVKLALGQTFGDNDYEYVTEERINGARTTTELPYNYLAINAIGLYPNINSTACFIVPFVSRTHIILFYSFTKYISRGWEEVVMEGEAKWKFFEEMMKDNSIYAKIEEQILKSFVNYNLTPLKKKYGFIKEEADGEGQKEIDKKPIEKTK